MIQVRPSRPEDDVAIKEVDASATATLRETYRPNKRALANKAGIAANLQRLVATINGQVVGTVEWDIDGDSVRVVGLGVHSDFRRQGVARQLLSSLEDIGRELGATRLHLHAVRQTGNVDVFTRLGFRIVAEQDDLFSESDRYPILTDIEMERILGK
jgi:ribosomal protein S18 acetylase RimI-like enzyme